MENIKFVLLICMFVFVPVFALYAAIRSLRMRLTPLLSIINGRFRFRYNLFFTGVIDGDWNGRNVKIELKYGGHGFTELDITLHSPNPMPVFKIRPTTSMLNSLMDLPASDFLLGSRFDIIELDMSIWTGLNQLPEIMQFLVFDRISIIKNLFTDQFSSLEVCSDPIKGGCLKLSIEGHCVSNSRDACHEAIEPDMMSHTLEMLKEFESAKATDIVDVPVIAAV